MSVTANDDQFMARALELARLGIGLASPNPHVGAVIVSEGKIVGEGTHAYAGRKHAEVLALEQAGERARGATLYLNLEPCCHLGRTGPCADALVAAGIRRVVASMADPNPLVAGKGFARLREAGIEITTGAEEEEARKLNEAFATWIRTRRPLVTLKSAMTLDGKIAPAPSDSNSARANLTDSSGRSWITGPLARTHVQEMRHQSDAILVGIGTILADDPLLTDRSGKPRRRSLLRVVLDSKLRMPLDSRIVQSVQGDLLVFCGSAEAGRQTALEQRGVRVEPLKPSDETGYPGWQEILTRLGEMEITSLLIEGGSHVNGAALTEGVVDKILAYYAPRILGEGEAVPFASGMKFAAMSEAPHVRCISWHRFGEDFAIEGYLRDPYGAY
jgi:diaminohydroxyphosphoribosylaminopyrimidine deaminase/5-amino-6-(5-phosphoribosylamino)uracil reductase